MFGFLGFLVVKALMSRMAVRIGFRNLTRQFRRNLMLGVCIAIGMVVLVVTTSFTNGMSDILFNKMIVYMSGHLRVDNKEYTSRRIDVIRDVPKIKQKIMETVEGIDRVEEEVGAFTRSFGNGKSGLLMLVGLPEGSSFYEDTDLEEGSVSDIFKPDTFPGMVLYKGAAKDLNVKLNDTVKLQFETIYGQKQVAQLKVVGIIPSENMFMDMAGFTDSKVLREYLNMRPQEAIGLNVVTKFPDSPARVIASANALYTALVPEAAGIKGDLVKGSTNISTDIFAFEVSTNKDAPALLSEKLQFISGRLDDFTSTKNGILLTEPLAKKLKASSGTRLSLSYQPKFDTDMVSSEVIVTGIVSPVEGFAEETAFANEEVFYKVFFWNLPKEPAVVSHDNALFSALLPEWDRLPRTPDSTSSMKKMLNLNKENWKGTRLDVSSMYETASAVIDIERGLNIVSFIAVLILFFVILIGVVNTMRMSIRERTREIGTNRAIGMQRHDVRTVFVFEVVFLAFFACVVGVLLGFAVMWLLSLATFDIPGNMFSMFLVKKHLYFLPTFKAVFFTFGVIMMISYFIAFRTARHAANLRAADALRHYE